eukprot:16431053-Heterocapsa_arctica.AAC.2
MYIYIYIHSVLGGRQDVIDALHTARHAPSELDPVARPQTTTSGQEGAVALDDVAQAEAVELVRRHDLERQVAEVPADRALDRFLGVAPPKLATRALGGRLLGKYISSDGLRGGLRSPDARLGLLGPLRRHGARVAKRRVPARAPCGWPEIATV